MMNWKILCLLPGLTLASAVPAAYANNQTTHHAVVVAQSQQQGSTTPNDSGTTTTTPNDSGTTTNPSTTTPSDSGTTTTPSTTPSESGTTTKPAKLKVGSKGEAVKTAQTYLKQHNFYNGPIDGKFSKKTRLAVIKFQKSKGLKADGIIGPKTLAAMQ
ncbi:peptidoglycan-binding protein [Aetokthonos hydrillicola Thurmond2011]|jgi:peptidoglycan hydrolase-like protein with peptidoglycan-binding domain|uniref:Peptidoglycan-binding protein n=1 Tax=Aetokthonos hydrillicola Thurmond2011 TaxID=2712845 RepID=A0AAP5IFJ9_9CYAN|nr:peptidoglycan-binding domain-containing protein [Aetokthonos hydrillicola]MBO3459712.1 peptidoglycan-binding protein [Aetokthonos hydrillicola CCALA 1050]MBW4585145.1 peptidoglycan-binding protein [Aetokthonos hydrillicola CCALA 1050]MDR9899484.1 peptidoglycan-binding protein [Aetokthonos hydrillicola Thurmond2011]